jgi:hypothetical protein
VRNYYVPGLEEKDQGKVIRSLMQAHENSANDADDIATNTAAIAANTASIAAWPGTTVGQLPFPATQAASADANTLDDYEEGTWTPTFTFATAGDLAKTFSLQNGAYTKIGRLVSVSFAMVTSAFTHTTAAGNLLITGLPFTAVNDANYRAYAPLLFQGITKAGYTQIMAEMNGNTSQFFVQACGSGVNVSNVTAANMPTGGTVILAGLVNYVV